MKSACLALILLAPVLINPLLSDDWTRFHGVVGAGVNASGKPPTRWSDSENPLL